MTDEEKKALAEVLALLLNRCESWLGSRIWCTGLGSQNGWRCCICDTVTPFTQADSPYNMEHTPTCPIRLFGVDALWREQYKEL